MIALGADEIVMSDLSEISPIIDYTEKEFELWFLDYKLGKPNYKNGLEAKKNNDSLEAPLRVKVRLKNLKNGMILEMWKHYMKPKIKYGIPFAF